MPSKLRMCGCGQAMTALVAPGAGLADAWFMCTICDSPNDFENAAWIKIYYLRKFGSIEGGG